LHQFKFGKINEVANSSIFLGVGFVIHPHENVLFEGKRRGHFHQPGLIEINPIGYIFDVEVGEGQEDYFVFGI
jgi:hypothetical protein